MISFIENKNKDLKESNFQYSYYTDFSHIVSTEIRNIKKFSKSAVASHSCSLLSVISQSYMFLQFWYKDSKNNALDILPICNMCYFEFTLLVLCKKKKLTFPLTVLKNLPFYLS